MIAEDPRATETLATTWRPVHYLGSKLRFHESITSAINDVCSDGLICDLFAGSGVVSLALSAHRRVWANDIQEYSRILCSAALNPPPVKDSPSSLVSMALSSAFATSLSKAVSPLIEIEKAAIEQASNGNLDLLSIFSGGLREGHDDRRTRRAFEHFEATMRALDLNPSETAVLRHFGGSYFSVEQAYHLTCLLSFARGRHVDRDQLTAAAISTASDIVNSVGKQFAQPIRLLTKEGALKSSVAAQVHRNFSMNAVDRYLGWLDRYRDRPTPAQPHLTSRLDFRSALEQAPAGVSAIYADPPYTREHYSRYYHVLETMCLGDDPSVSNSNLSIGESRGVYRADRHQSPFCIASQARAAFARLFEGASKVGVPLILSYSPPSITEKSRMRVMSIEDITRIGLLHFSTVEIRTISGSKHNRLNRAELNSTAAEGSEVLMVFA